MQFINRFSYFNIIIFIDTNLNTTATINSVVSSNDKKENKNLDINKENINNNTKDQQIKDISSILPNNTIENTQKDSSNPISNIKIEGKTEGEKKKDTDSKEKKEDIPSEIINKDTNNSTEIKTENNTLNDSKNSIPLLRDKILKVKASLQKKLKEEGQRTTVDVMHTMKPGALLCERGGFIEVSKKFSNGIKPNSTISIETLDTVPLPNYTGKVRNNTIQKNRAEEIFKIYSKGSLETIKESEDETNTAPATSSVNNVNATTSSSVPTNPLLAALPASSTSTSTKHAGEEKDSFNAISKDDDLFNAILSSSDILSNDILSHTFGNSLLPSTSSTTPTPSLASAIIAPSSSSPSVNSVVKKDSSSTPSSNVNAINPVKSLPLITTEPSSLLNKDRKNGRSYDEVFSDFDIDANLTQNHLISLQDIYFAHEINPQHIFGSSAYSSEVLENLICVLAENDHSLIE
ncbi:hypothetical protein PIROE2DRAFT_16481 [Piromyces sp. E2]|nr:hypothetical protein PIROE2DRAFT_16481 [Piromyces sp. E2]|eukprot:OUM58293.1 hypothetical protein PIROE2DRAFT_16481 [Piromyces sp. E2]